MGGQSPGAGYHYDDDDDDDRCNGCRLHPADAANIGDNEKSGKIVGKSKKTKATKSVIKPKKVKKSKKKGVKGKKKGNAPKFTGSELLEIRQKIANILATATGCDTGGGGGGGTLTSSHDGGDHLNDDHRYYADCCHNLHHDTINAAEGKLFFFFSSFPNFSLIIDTLFQINRVNTRNLVYLRSVPRKIRTKMIRCVIT